MKPLDYLNALLAVIGFVQSEIGRVQADASQSGELTPQESAAFTAKMEAQFKQPWWTPGANPPEGGAQ
jgi:hypothetical protein